MTCQFRLLVSADSIPHEKQENICAAEAGEGGDSHPVTRNLVKLQLRSRLGHQLLLLLLQLKKSTAAYRHFSAQCKVALELGASTTAAA